MRYVTPRDVPNTGIVYVSVVSKKKTPQAFAWAVKLHHRVGIAC